MINCHKLKKRNSWISSMGKFKTNNRANREAEQKFRRISCESQIHNRQLADWKGFVIRIPNTLKFLPDHLINAYAMPKFIDYLQSISDFTKEELNMLAKHVQIAKVKKGTTLAAFGEVPKYLYFVNSGCLRTFYRSDNGAEFIRCIAFENSFCWTVPSFLKQQPSNESIDALCESDLVMISKKSIDYLNEKSAGFRTAYQKGLEQLCMNYASRVESFLTMDAKTRYESLLAKNPVIVQQLSNKVIASYLGITQESLSRIKRQF